MHRVYADSDANCIFLAVRLSANLRQMEAKTRKLTAAAVRRVNDIYGTVPQSNRKSVSEVEANPDTH